MVSSPERRDYCSGNQGPSLSFAKAHSFFLASDFEPKKKLLGSSNLFVAALVVAKQGKVWMVTRVWTKFSKGSGKMLAMPPHDRATGLQQKRPAAKTSGNDDLLGWPRRRRHGSWVGGGRWSARR